MNSVLPPVLIAVLVAIAGLHAYWGTGGRWPAKDEAALAGLVIGKTPGKRMPPPLACFAVAVAILIGTCLIAAASYGQVQGLLGRLLAFAYCIFTAVFVLRGLAGYLPKLWAPSIETPFFALNRRYYSPLCLALGAGLIFNLLGR